MRGYTVEEIRAVGGDLERLPGWDQFFQEHLRRQAEVKAAEGDLDAAEDCLRRARGYDATVVTRPGQEDKR